MFPSNLQFLFIFFLGNVWLTDGNLTLIFVFLSENNFYYGKTIPIVKFPLHFYVLILTKG